MYKLVAEKYGDALFQVAKTMNSQDQILEELALVVDAFKREESLALFINHPEVDDEDKKKVLVDLFGDKISQEVQNFLFVVIDKGREAHLEAMLAQYQKQMDAYHKVQEVTVTTTTPLNQGQERKITKFLAKKLGTNVRLKERIDPSIIGGLILDMDGKRLDRSIAMTLESLRYELTR